MATGVLGGILMLLAALTAFVLVVAFIIVPLFRGIGAFIAACFAGIGWLFRHVFEFIGGMIGDTVRSVGAVLAMIVLSPLALLNVIIGRWSAAGHFAESVRREASVAGACVYRVLLRRPLKLFWLHGLLEGVEQRVPEAMHASPGSDRPTNRTGQFEGYTIVGSLAGGGSGGKLYIARPDEAKRKRLTGQPEHVVIKAFALSEGSSLPQIVRESRALECAKKLGHVLDHGMDDHRFHYVMPYHPGDHLGIITRQLHGESDGALDKDQLGQVMAYLKDLLATLTLYHDGGLWHKDVKPENIIVHDGRAHLVDLGLVTPLKSAMTLTTHGTEYFRDPEMVRQALRGVKVHQVNGAKFDIYAVGAVLYYMIENTFPAHGGLSRFSKRSPEALRWIIRRSMAEYQQRYSSAAMMLADLEAVASSSDPFAFKPAALPSMQAGDGDDVKLDVDVQAQSPHAAQVTAAGSPRPRFAAGQGASPIRQRPSLRVTNWWTGAYVVDGAKHQPRIIGRRKSARDQVRAARARAAAMQSRIASKRQRPPLERGPSATLGLLGVIFLAIVAAVVVTMYRSGGPGGGTSAASVQPTVGTLREGKPVLLVVDAQQGAEADWASQSDQVQTIVQRYEQRGYHVVQQLHAPATDPRDVLTAWQSQDGSQPVDALEDFLAEHDLYGFLHIKSVIAADGTQRFSEGLIHSTRSDAAARRWANVSPSSAPPQGDVLWVNDHPARSDAAVALRIEQLYEGYRAAGWSLSIDDEKEAAIRRALPVSVEPDTTPSARLEKALHERSLAGVLYVHAGGGGPSASQRVQVVELLADQSATIEP